MASRCDKIGDLSLPPSFGEKYRLRDGIHPTAQGQRVVAKKWLNVVADGITL